MRSAGSFRSCCICRVLWRWRPVLNQGRGGRDIARIRFHFASISSLTNAKAFYAFKSKFFSKSLMVPFFPHFTSPLSLLNLHVTPPTPIPPLQCPSSRFPERFSFFFCHSLLFATGPIFNFLYGPASLRTVVDDNALPRYKSNRVPVAC
jgi:hypothetical protein